MSAKLGRGTLAHSRTIPVHVGGIVRAPITPNRGVTKQRPCVVLTELERDETAPLERRFLVVGLTSDGGEYDSTNNKKYPPDEYIQIPHAENGDSTTGLRLPSAAYVEFVAPFNESLLKATTGYLDARLLDSLIKKLQACLAKKSD